MVKAAEALLERGAPVKFTPAPRTACSPVPAIERIRESKIKKLVVSDTIPLPPEKQIDKIQSLTIAPLFAEALRRIHSEHSVSILFR
jgi:ribose-phosphate pyrophosphokinase